MVCMSEKKGGDYRCLFISFIEYQHICTVGVNIKSTHAVHLSLQVYTCDSNYRVFTTIKIRSNVYMVWPYTVLYRGKINYLSVQCHLNVLDLLSYSQKNIKKKHKRTYVHIHHRTCKRNKILKTSRWIVYMHTLLTAILYSHTCIYQVTSSIRMSKYLTYDNDNIEK
jgi:hypothetical protein